MPTTGFHSEWVTVDGHRLLLTCRAGFPDDRMHFIAKVATQTCNHNSNDEDARVVEINYDDKACIWSIKIASTKKEDTKLEGLVMQALHTIFGDGNCQAEVVVVPEGDRGSDHYCHMEHLSAGAEVAVDRWQKTPKYWKTVESPR